jgi:hypothetical protein
MKPINKAYKIFKDKIKKEDFNISLDALGESKWNFVRACLLIIDAIRCRKINTNITVSLLCSAVECISSNKPQTILFKDWLICNKISTLSKKTDKELKELINKSYNEYVETEDEREGARYNFRKFLIDYCSEELKNSEIMKEIKEENGEIKEEKLTFEDTIDYIYAKYRSFFIHRGIGRVPTENDLKNYNLGNILLDKFNNKIIRIEFNIEWFINVVKSSLLSFLAKSIAEAV